LRTKGYAPGTSRTLVGVGDFQDTVRPSVAAIDSFAGACVDLVDRYSHLPSVTVPSAAMEDLAGQATYQKEPWDGPIEETHSLIGLFTLAGLDHMRAYGRIVGGEPVPIWSHLVAARSALEAFGYAHWLTEQPLDTASRVQRTKLLRLRDAFEMCRYDQPEYKQKGRSLKDSVRRGAEANGWTVSFSKKTINGEEVIKAKDAIDRVLGGHPDDSTGGVGPVLWSYFSGATHSYTYALVQSAERSHETSLSSSTTVRAGLYINTKIVHTLAASLVMAGLITVESRCSYMGWVDSPWVTATNAARTYLSQIRGSIQSD
jgi:hypothetical protein